MEMRKGNTPEHMQVRTHVSVHDAKEEREGNRGEQSGVGLAIAGHTVRVDDTLENLSKLVGVEVCGGRRPLFRHGVHVVGERGARACEKYTRQRHTSCSSTPTQHPGTGGRTCVVVSGTDRLLDLHHLILEDPRLAAQHALHVRLEQVQRVEDGLLAAFNNHTGWGRK